MKDKLGILRRYWEYLNDKLGIFEGYIRNDSRRYWEYLKEIFGIFEV